MVKFKNCSTDLEQIEIVLTDFGMANSDSKGGTPIFASPECFEQKDKNSDIFSFGRVILFLLLTKKQFVEWLFIPIRDRKNLFSLRNLVVDTPNLVSQMTSLTSRISLQSARILFDRLRKNSRLQLNSNLITAIQSIINNEISTNFEIYTSELCDFRYEISIYFVRQK